MFSPKSIEMFNLLLLLCYSLEVIHFTKGQVSDIKGEFKDGNAEFEWTPLSDTEKEEVNVRLSGASHTHDLKIFGKYIQQDVLNFTTVDIRVRTFKNRRKSDSKYYRFNTPKAIDTKGGDIYIEIPIDFVPVTGLYSIQSSFQSKKLFEVSGDDVKSTEPAKYKYVRKSDKSITIRITNVTNEDAGYIWTGTQFNRNGPGVVLVVKDISKNAKYTTTSMAHCLRATTIHEMNDAGFGIQHIMHITGHKKEVSIRRYNRDCETAHKQSMSDKLAALACGIKDEPLSVPAPVPFVARPLEVNPRVTRTALNPSGSPTKPTIAGQVAVQVGEDVKLTCESKSTSAPSYYKLLPQLTYTWYRNDSGFTWRNSNQWTFRVEKKHKYDTIRCMSREEDDSLHSEPLILNPQYGPDAVKISPEIQETINVTLGRNFGPYTCSANCNPPCRYQWQRLASGRLYNDIGIGQTLSISPVDKADASKYRCQANSDYKNSNGSTKATKSVTLRVLYGPDTVIISPEIQETVDVMQGKRFGPYTCSADCYPPCRSQWQRLKSDHVGIGSNLTFSKVDKADANTYICQVDSDYKNSNGSTKATKSVTLRVLYGPDTVMISPEINKTVDVIQGRTFGPYTCSADCNPPCRYQWQRLKSGSQYDDVGTGPTFAILQTDKTHANNYRCQVHSDYNNSIGSTRATKSVTLRVLYLSEPVVYTDNGTINTSTFEENVRINLSCKVEGVPRPLVSIIRDRNTLSADNEWSNYTFLRGLKCKDTGNYICAGKSNGFDPKEKSFHISVLCSTRLDVASFPKYLYDSQIGKNISVIIPVISNPQPDNLTWKKPENAAILTKIVQREVVYRHVIESIIYTRKPSEFGDYTLLVGGEQLITITIYSEGPPFQPLNFSGISELPGQINLIWISTFNGGPDQFFLLEQKNNSEWLQIANISDIGQGRQMSIVVDETIEAGRTYEFSLQSCNRINCSEVIISAPIRVKGIASPVKSLNVIIMVGIILAGVFVIFLIIMTIVVWKICKNKRGIKKVTRKGVQINEDNIAYERRPAENFTDNNAFDVTDTGINCQNNSKKEPYQDVLRVIKEEGKFQENLEMAQYRKEGAYGGKFSTFKTDGNEKNEHNNTCPNNNQHGTMFTALSCGDEVRLRKSDHHHNHPQGSMYTALCPDEEKSGHYTSLHLYDEPKKFENMVKYHNV